MDIKKEEKTVAGFLFGTKEDADLARQEEEKIAYIESRLHYEKTENVEAVYRKALENKVFQTPVGFVYLKKLQDFLHQSGAQNVPDIPLYHVFTASVLNHSARVRARMATPVKKDLMKNKLRGSYCLNAALIILVIAMFVIASTASNPNIINYEQALQNKYAQWEEDLKARENAIREKELLYKLEEAEN